MKSFNRLFTICAGSLIATHANASLIMLEASEPATLSLLCIGLLGLGLARRKVKSADKS